MSPLPHLHSSLPFFLMLLLAPSLLLVPGSAFYLPGIAPVDYGDGAELSVFASKLTSRANHVPYDYYQLPMCKPQGQEEKKKIKNSKRVNLGQLLTGEKMKPTKYEVYMNVPEKCKILCTKPVSEKQIEQLQRRIDDDYTVRLNMDNMPAVRTVQREGQVEPSYVQGVPLGYISDGIYYLNNHLDMKILIHKPSFTSYDIYQPETEQIHRVVGFQVTARSFEKKDDKCVGSNPFPLVIGQTKELLFSYSVEFEESPIRWATRWDPLLKASAEERKVQWFSLINSAIIGLIVTVVVGLILLRTVFKDFARYNNLEEHDSIQEDFGWKMVHGDVFRVPQLFGLMCVLVGAGAQILCMSTVVLIFALAGFLSPANRGGLLTMMLFAEIFTNVVNGYATARLYSGMGGESKRSITTSSALFYSVLVFGTFFILNALGYFAKSSSAVPFFTLIMLFVIWFGLSIPLNVIGAFLGYKGEAFAFPCKVNQIPRSIPEGTLTKTTITCTLAGIFPFFISFLQLIFILNSLWEGTIFYMFGFLTVVYILVILSTVEVSMVVTYFSLSAENHHWWWPAFVSGASCGLYTFAYCLYYLHYEIEWKRHFVSTCMILGYTALMSISFSLMLGAIALMSSLFFVIKMYSAIKTS